MVKNDEDDNWEIFEKLRVAERGLFQRNETLIRESFDQGELKHPPRTLLFILEGVHCIVG